VEDEPMSGGRSLDVRRVLAEFAIIVSGVLIALSADRWVQGFEARALEAFYLQGLETDLESDSTGLALKQTQEETRMTSISELYGALEEGPEAVGNAAGFVGGFEKVGWMTPMDYATATWSELIGAGHLGYLRDEELRRALSRYYEEQERLSHIEEDMDRLFWLLQERTIQVNPLPVRLSALRDTARSPDSRVRIGLEDVERVLDAVRRDEQMSSYIGEAHVMARGRIALFGDMRWLNADVLAHVREVRSR